MSDEAGERDGGSTEESTETSSREAGSEGEVTMSGEPTWPRCSVRSGVFAVSSECSVGRLGVDFDWKPAGGCGGCLNWSPLLCGGIVVV